MYLSRKRVSNEKLVTFQWEITGHLVCKFLLNQNNPFWCWPCFAISTIVHRWSHGMFLDWWNTIKGLFNIWKQLSNWWEDCQNRPEIEISQCFLSHLQDMTDHPAHLTATYWPVLACSQTAIVGINFLAYFCNPRIK